MAWADPDIEPMVLCNASLLAHVELVILANVLYNPAEIRQG